MDFDVLVIGGGAAGMSCALVLGSGMSKPFAENKKAGILLHQKSSHLHNAVFNNVLGLRPGSRGKDILTSGPIQLKAVYPEITQIENEKALGVSSLDHGFQVSTNKKTYSSTLLVIAIGYTELFKIKGLDEFVIPHKKAKPSKNRIQLKNEDHLVIPGLYVAGTLAGWRSQFSIACGSGAAVATDILTLWNEGVHTKIHDKLK